MAWSELKDPGGFSPQDFGSKGYTAPVEKLMEYGQSVGEYGRGAMMESLRRAQLRAHGGAPTLAQDQLKQGQESALRGAVALAGTGRGGNIGAMTTQAANAGAGSLAATNETAAQMRIQEQQIAEQQFAEQAQAAAMMQLQYEQLAQSGALSGQQLSQDYELGRRGADLAQNQYHTDRNMGYLKMGTNAVGNLLGGLLSDERAKENIRPNEIAPAIGELAGKSKRFDYSPGFGAPNQAGLLAQDVEQTTLGPQLVMDTPDGKMLDTKNASVLALAGTAEQEQRLQKLEAAFAESPGARTVDPFAGDGSRPEKLYGSQTVDPFEGEAPKGESGGAVGGILSKMGTRDETVASMPNWRETLARRNSGQKPVLIRRPGSEGWIMPDASLLADNRRVSVKRPSSTTGSA